MATVIREFCSIRNGCLTYTLKTVLSVFLVSCAVIIIACIGWLIDTYILKYFGWNEATWPRCSTCQPGGWPIYWCIGMLFLLCLFVVIVALTFTVVSIFNCTYSAYREARQRAAAYDALEMSNYP